ncbi:MAG: hypothetical protein GXY85_07490 [Candidatus Brocadiaceae bacterium]|nr:hypothetical protein [Candidatus Brocadiaceae bacterium]
MAPLLLGLDVGTSAVKAGVFTDSGRLLGLGRAGHAVQSPAPGWTQCKPQDWWHGVVAALHAACAAASVRPDELAAVGLGTLFPCVVPLDAAGRALHPAILYSDLRSTRQVHAVERAVGRRLYERMTGNRLVPGTCAATSLMWLRDERTDAYRRAHTLGFANTFVTARLTGRFFTDPSHAAISGLTDIRDPWRWSDDLCALLRVDVARLPPILGSGEAAGAVTRKAADATGLRPGTPVACGAGDVPAGVLGAGGHSADTLIYIAGTTDCTALPTRRPAEEPRCANSAYVPREAWLSIGTTTSSGAAAAWAAREVSGLALEEMTSLADSAAPGAGGVVFLPYLQGERTPVWDPLARGALLGLTSSTTRADIARAIFEGVAFALRQLVECADAIAPAPLRHIRAVGGPTANAFLNQLKADVLARPLGVAALQETGALGAALLGGMAAGVYGSFGEAVACAEALVDVHTFEPDPARTAAYAEVYRVYADAYAATRDLTHRLAALPHRTPSWLDRSI